MKTSFLTLFCLLYLSSSLFCQKIKPNISEKGFHDTNTYTILSFSEFKSRIYPFDSLSVDTYLSASEMLLLEKLFFKGIANYNIKISKQVQSSHRNRKEKKEALRDFSIPIFDSFYIKQLIPFTTQKGYKMVYINCFGSSPDNKETFWKKDLIQVMDGGNGYFQLIINITNKTIDYVGINGFG